MFRRHHLAGAGCSVIHLARDKWLSNVVRARSGSSLRSRWSTIRATSHQSAPFVLCLRRAGFESALSRLQRRDRDQLCELAEVLGRDSKEELVFEHPQLAGRIAYDSRFELLTGRQLHSVIELRNLVAGWRSTLRGYSVFVLDKVDDGKPIRALVKAKEASVVLRRGPVVVLQRR